MRARERGSFAVTGHERASSAATERERKDSSGAARVSEGSESTPRAGETMVSGARVREGATPTAQAWVVERVRGHRGLLAGLIALQTGVAVCGVALAPVMRAGVDAAVARSNRLFWVWVAALGALLLVQVLLSAVSRHMLERARTVLENALRGHVFRAFITSAGDSADAVVVAGADADAGTRENGNAGSTVGSVVVAHAGASAATHAGASDAGARANAPRTPSAHTGELMNLLTSDVTVVSDGMVTLLPGLTSMAVRLVGVLVVLYALQPALAVALTVCGACLAAASAAFRPMLKRLHATMQRSEGRMRAFMQECLESRLVVWAFGCGDKVARRSTGNMEEYARDRMRRADASNIAMTGFNLAIQGAYLLGFIWCGAGILAGTVSYGTLVAVIQLVGQMRGPLVGVGGMSARYAALLASAERLMDAAGEHSGFAAHIVAEGPSGGAALRDRCVDVDASERRGDAEFGGAGHGDAELDGAGLGDTTHGVAPHSDSANSASRTEGASCTCRSLAVATCYEGLRELRAEGVAYTYASTSAYASVPSCVSPHPAAQGVEDPSAPDLAPNHAPDLAPCSFTVRKGQFAAVVGESGAGKSTLVKLLLGYLHPSAGRIVLAGEAGEVPLAEAPRGLFAYVPQGNGLMAGTVAEAVAFSEQGPRINLARVREACRLSCADSFVEALPDGYNTVLGERGAGLSEGQLQRLAIARALYSGAPILLLDEATSALDARTERDVLQSLRSLGDRTVLAVTHRPEALRLRDVVISVEKAVL